MKKIILILLLFNFSVSLFAYHENTTHFKYANLRDSAYNAGNNQLCLKYIDTLKQYPYYRQCSQDWHSCCRNAVTEYVIWNKLGNYQSIVDNFLDEYGYQLFIKAFYFNTDLRDFPIFLNAVDTLTDNYFLKDEDYDIAGESNEHEILNPTWSIDADTSSLEAFNKSAILTINLFQKEHQLKYLILFGNRAFFEMYKKYDKDKYNWDDSLKYDDSQKNYVTPFENYYKNTGFYRAITRTMPDSKFAIFDITYLHESNDSVYLYTIYDHAIDLNIYTQNKLLQGKNNTALLASYYKNFFPGNPIYSMICGLYYYNKTIASEEGETYNNLNSIDIYNKANWNKLFYKNNIVGDSILHQQILQWLKQQTYN